MSSKPSIFLVGPMGAGKTTIGRQLAQTLGRPFHDSDREIEQRTGVDIPTIFEYEGEEGFRQREAAMIDELTRLPGIVLATGGGSVLRPENRKALASRGLVVYLKTPVAVQLARTAHDRNRPLLQTDDPEARLRALFEQRDPLYREVADLILDTGRLSIRQIIRQIEQRLNVGLDT
ncbi:MAG: shikimate kinase AroK [Gammaproteobacteria bacterium]|nr:MAG: shikimate kinase AroK [Gammaproteobacteria bacterium]